MGRERDFLPQQIVCWEIKALHSEQTTLSGLNSKLIHQEKKKKKAASLFSEFRRKLPVPTWMLQPVKGTSHCRKKITMP